MKNNNNKEQNYIKKNLTRVRVRDNSDNKKKKITNK